VTGAAATIRRATYADVEVLAGLRRAWVEEQQGAEVDDPGFEQAFADWFDREHDQRVTWLATAAHRPVGMLNMLVFTRMPKPGRPTSRWGYLANFFVLADHRGAGIGTRLLAECTQYADAHEFARIVLSPSERSRRLYERGGFGPADSLLVRPGRD
jgi:GNAT superfamily N-acetyltransferase